MKTQIILLEHNEDHISVRDKMNWNQARRILLVWPKHGDILNQKLDLILVLRHADSLGARLALVTQDAGVRFYADQLGISVFENPIQAQDAQWRKHPRTELNISDNNLKTKRDSLQQVIHRPKAGWLDHPMVRVICLTMSLLALGGLGIFILPGARIKLSPQVESQTMVFDLSADPSIDMINYSTGTLPTYIQELAVEGHDSSLATGRVTIPDKPATGRVSFYNFSDLTITIPQHTVVTTLGKNPVRFVTTSPEEIRVEPEQSAELPAQAIKPGRSGNLEPDELVVIEGAIGQGLRVTNPAAMTGGSETKVPSPSEKDLSDLRQRLVDSLLKDASIKMQSTLPKGDILLDPYLREIDTLSETIFPAVGEAGNQLELTLKLKIRSYVVSDETLRDFITPIMDTNTPAGYSALTDTLLITQTHQLTLGENEKVLWTIRVERQLHATIPAERAIEMARGSSISYAIQALSAAFPLAQTPLIQLSPGWWPWLPLIPMRIEILQTGVQ